MQVIQYLKTSKLKMEKRLILIVKKKIKNLAANFSWVAVLEVVTFTIIGLLLWFILGLYLG